MTKLLPCLGTVALVLSACLPRTTPAASAEPFALAGTAVASATYLCDSGKSAEATYYQNGVQLSYDSVAYTLPQVVSGSGARYADERLEWWTKGPVGFVANPATGVFLDTCREAEGTAQPAGAPDALNASYLIDGEVYTLSGGRASQPIPGSAAELVIEVVASAAGPLEPFAADPQAAAVVLRQETGGSGTFYYLAALTSDAERLVPAVSLGDRIELQDLTIDENGVITVRYLDRAEGQSFAEAASVETLQTFILEGDRLVALANLEK